MRKGVFEITHHQSIGWGTIGRMLYYQHKGDVIKSTYWDITGQSIRFGNVSHQTIAITTRG